MNPIIVKTSIKKLSLTIKTKDDGSISSQENITLSMGNYVPVHAKLENLEDVNAENKSNGAVLIYNENSNKYDVKLLPPASIDGALDNGEF